MAAHWLSIMSRPRSEPSGGRGMPGSLFLQPSAHAQAMHMQTGRMPSLRTKMELDGSGQACRQHALSVGNSVMSSLMCRAHCRCTALTGATPSLTSQQCTGSLGAHARPRCCSPTTRRRHPGPSRWAPERWARASSAPGPPWTRGPSSTPSPTRWCPPHADRSCAVQIMVCEM